MDIRLYIGSILIFFIFAFVVRNVKTYLSTKQAIRGRSAKLTLSILLSTFIYLYILWRLWLPAPSWMLEFEVPGQYILETAGVFLVTIGFVLGILALLAMRDSWRVGIRYDQQTALVTKGIYRWSRNPYFLSWDVLILGYFLVFPGLVFLALYLAMVLTFHFMILEEEAYLDSVHGHTYLEYRKRTARYFLWI